VVIPDGVETIGASAFYNDNALLSVIIPPSVTSIGTSAFGHCLNLSKITLQDGTTITGAGIEASVEMVYYNTLDFDNTVAGGDNTLTQSEVQEHIGNSGNPTAIYANIDVVNISASAFSNNANLLFLSMSDSVTSIGDQAFSNCNGIGSITLDANIVTLGTSTFNQCTNVTRISIGSSVTALPSGIFTSPRLNSTNQITVTMPSSLLSTYNNNDYLPSNPIIVVVVYLTASDDVTLTKTNVTDQLANITDYSNVYIGGNVKSIGTTAFDGIPLSTISIPSSVTEIGVSAFEGITELETLTLNEGLKTIGANAFKGCTNISLSVITIPSSITSIGANAFTGCNGLTSMSIPNNSSEPITMGASVFSSCQAMTQATISVETLGENAFEKCSSLASLTINTTVKTIGASAFFDCSNGTFTTISIPDSVTMIEKGAFQSCSALETVSGIPTITAIPEDLFKGCTKLSELSLFTDQSRINQFTSIGAGAFTDCSSLYIPTLDLSATTIGELSNNTFKNCDLSNIILPTTITALGVDCLRTTHKLNSVTFQEETGTMDTSMTYLRSVNTGNDYPETTTLPIKTFIDIHDEEGSPSDTNYGDGPYPTFNVYLGKGTTGLGMFGTNITKTEDNTTTDYISPIQGGLSDLSATIVTTSGVEQIQTIGEFLGDITTSSAGITIDPGLGVIGIISNDPIVSNANANLDPNGKSISDFMALKNNKTYSVYNNSNGSSVMTNTLPEVYGTTDVSKTFLLIYNNKLVRTIKRNEYYDVV